MSKTVISTVEEFIRQTAEMIAGHVGQPQIGQYHSLQEFVLRHGRKWEYKPLPHSVHRGVAKACYHNAASLAMSSICYGDRYIYCEGYASAVFPVPHAWCIDENGNVVDNTWNHGGDYYGIAFLDDYVRKKFVKDRVSCLIDDWQGGWPVLKISEKRWKHPINYNNERTTNGRK